MTEYEVGNEDSLPDYQRTSFKLTDNAFPRYIKNRYLVLNQSIKHRKTHLTCTQVCS